MAGKKTAWTMQRGYAAGGKSVTQLGPPPKGPAVGSRKQSPSVRRPPAKP
jgi:hypothetical protein